MELVLFWFGFSILCGVIGASKGRSGFLVFLAAIFLTPVLTLIYILAVPKHKNVDPPTSSASSVDIACPKCAETIKRAAKVCRFCGLDLEAHRVEQERGKAATLDESIASDAFASDSSVTNADIDTNSNQQRRASSAADSNGYLVIPGTLVVILFAAGIPFMLKDQPEFSETETAVEAVDESYPPIITGSSKVDNLIYAFKAADAQCKAGDTAACDTRDKEIGPQLNKIGWCSQNKNQKTDNHTWHLCDSNSRRY